MSSGVFDGKGLPSLTYDTVRDI